MKRQQTCLVPIYDENGQRIRFDIKMPKIITEDLGFEMMFGMKASQCYPSSKVYIPETVIPSKYQKVEL